jgi:hypothetical protein
MYIEQDNIHYMCEQNLHIYENVLNIEMEERKKKVDERSP